MNAITAAAPKSNTHLGPHKENSDNMTNFSVPPILTRQEFTTRTYINKLLSFYFIGLMLILLSTALLVIAILTNDWYILNVNEYIPTSKGGLWTYCFIATTGYMNQYTCMVYEELPNFAVFVTQSLYTSRILIVCSAGFLAIIIAIELIGELFANLKLNNIDRYHTY